MLTNQLIFRINFCKKHTIIKQDSRACIKIFKAEIKIRRLQQSSADRFFAEEKKKYCCGGECLYVQYNCQSYEFLKILTK